MRQTHSVDVGKYTVVGDVTYEWIDDSFDHAFGTEHCGHQEAVDVDLLEAYLIDDETAVELEDLPEIVKTEAIEKLKQERV